VILQTTFASVVIILAYCCYKHLYFTKLSILEIFLDHKWGIKYVCDRALAGMVGSNPTGDMDVCLSYSVCVVR
jgi:hypothetical protein